MFNIVYAAVTTTESSIVITGKGLWTQNDAIWVNVTYVDTAGRDNLNYATLKVDTRADGQTFTLKYNQSANSFSETIDASNICTLLASSITDVDANTRTLHFQFNITGGNFGEVDLIRTYVEDDAESKVYTSNYTADIWDEDASDITLFWGDSYHTSYFWSATADDDVKNENTDAVESQSAYGLFTNATAVDTPTGADQTNTILAYFWGQGYKISYGWGASSGLRGGTLNQDGGANINVSVKNEDLSDDADAKGSPTGADQTNTILAYFWGQGYKISYGWGASSGLRGGTLNQDGGANVDESVINGNLQERSPSPAAPIITSPLNATQHMINSNVLFNWTLPAGETQGYYLFQIDDNAAFASPSTDNNATTGNLYGSVTMPGIGGWHYFRMMYITEEAWESDWSDVLVLDLLVNIAPTNDACDSTASFEYDTYGWVNVTITDADLVADFNTLVLTITTADGKILEVTWTQATDTFTESNDPDSIGTLDTVNSARVNIDGDTDQICFKIKFNDVSLPGLCSVQSVVTDDSAESDTDGYNNEFTIDESEATITSPASGTIYALGTHFTVTWTLPTGMTSSAYQVETGPTGFAFTYYDTGKITSSDLTVIIQAPDSAVPFEVRVTYWDQYDHERGPSATLGLTTSGGSSPGPGGEDGGDDPDDVDGDGIPNGEDPDVDGDGIPNGEDYDIDGDGIPNSTDVDMDGDGIPNGDDSDTDGDGIPNDLDNDIDGDGIPNSEDVDMDNDGISDEEDLDIDGDGIPNTDDGTPYGGEGIVFPPWVPETAQNLIVNLIPWWKQHGAFMIILAVIVAFLFYVLGEDEGKKKRKNGFDVVLNPEKFFR